MNSSDSNNPLDIDRLRQGERIADPAFDGSEWLYRRFDPDKYLVEGVLSPLAFGFPKQSVNRGKYSHPKDVLHTNCCDGKSLVHWRVASFQVRDIPPILEGSNGRTYFCFVRHSPKPMCYAHSEIWCNDEGPHSESYAKPPKLTREQFRAKLAEAAMRTWREQRAEESR